VEAKSCQRFLDAWRAGDYPTSFDSLHRFFDYTMQNRDKLFYQYALLNLAVLQADFGCYEEAVAAMQETVSTARENKDMGCLNFSLSWLYHFGKAHPDVIKHSDKTNMLGVEREALAFLRAKAKESGMWSLWSSSLLSEAKMGLSNGESVATAFENILRSSELAISKNLVNTIGSQLIMQSAIWSRLGIAQLARLQCEVFLRCYAGNAPFDDTLKFTCRSAYLLAQKGQYDEAMAKIESLDPNSLRSLKPSQYYLRMRGLLQLKRDLHHNDLAGAQHLLDQLLQTPQGDPDLTFELQILHVDFLTRSHNYPLALSTLESLATTLKTSHEDIYYLIRMLTLKALLHSKVGRPQKGFSIAVRAANLAWRARLLPALWHAVGAISNVLTSLREFHASISLLASILPRALEVEDLALAAQLYSFLADAHMGQAGQAAKGSRERTEGLTQALEWLERAGDSWRKVEDVLGERECMAKKAVIMHLVGDEGLKNDYAARYSDLGKERAGGA
jgi:anaphase-promoting complex subunit 5